MSWVHVVFPVNGGLTITTEGACLCIILSGGGSRVAAAVDALLFELDAACHARARIYIFGFEHWGGAIAMRSMVNHARLSLSVTL